MKNTALVIVDMQNFFLKNSINKDVDSVINNQRKVIDFFNKNNSPIVFLEYQDEKNSRGCVLPVLSKKAKNKYTIKKLSNGGFTNTDLNKILKDLKIKKIVLVGINANGCVQDTAIGAIRRGYEIISSEDLMANIYFDNLGLSRNNKKWYQENTKFFEKYNTLLKYLK